MQLPSVFGFGHWRDGRSGRKGAGGPLGYVRPGPRRQRRGKRNGRPVRQAQHRCLVQHCPRQGALRTAGRTELGLPAAPTVAWASGKPGARGRMGGKAMGSRQWAVGNGQSAGSNEVPNRAPCASRGSCGRRIGAPCALPTVLFDTAPSLVLASLHAPRCGASLVTPR